MPSAKRDIVAALLLALWILGLTSSYTMGGFIHVLLIVAIGLIALRVLQPRDEPGR